VIPRIRLACALALLASASVVWAAPHPTAVYTLDHRHGEVAADSVRGIPVALESWARGCRIVDGGALYQLDCGPAPERRPAEDEGEALPATLALLRDLDETVYLAGCPVLDEERIKRLEREASKPAEERAPDPGLEADLRDCAEIETGRTFSVEVEGDEMRAVVRGRQLRLSIYHVQPKERRTSTPYDSPATRGSLGHAGPATTATAELNPVDEPNWAPPQEPQTLARPRSAEPSLRDPGVAKTTLRSGTLRVECTGRGAEIWVDEAFLGFAPVETPVLAGRHTVKARKAGLESAGEVELKAGERLTVDLCRGALGLGRPAAGRDSAAPQP
jgi:hypothetical protein